jgi:ABC-type transport system involved in multi-copper enzyme maturation permease subunit
LLAVAIFEFKRIMTPGRAFWWLVVAAFPVVITLLMSTYLIPERRASVPQQPESIQEIGMMFTFALYVLGPSLSCMLGVLLTSAPIVATELEQHSWVYLATRPNGLFHLLMGKYLVAVVWTASAAILGIALAIPISQIHYKWEALFALTGLAVLSSFAYAALYLMIGTLFHAKAMVFCVAYTAAVELFLGMFPAVVNRMTIQFRLRSLLFRWITVDDNTIPANVIDLIASNETMLLQLVWLAALTAVFLSVALVTVQVREFTTAAESEL